ncbi:amidohydrolase family protein [Actinoalloteichus hymeniacidonis]|uniref:TIM-barrel fold metal-dependent hydrolase n=1 Tax=Actinoalloteichus hymeniacidonis TaxID=340345 RepID=A0AAC9HLV5_9PSEU|nr:amidohydrolase family protein [Actinoalloteichus hymeniacidonis]AOS61687.1 putative TIM-barrel fold metal-dependent hydrolase [Actinoalloteichus hymeniacidonis]MBB5910298.1 aminocarboxymuconate-semialdehyde decarboxylase [Actinoalloteichus hymeniacidonis]
MATTAPRHAIDAHAHVYPADYLDRLESIGVDPATTKVARNMKASDDDADLSARLRMMDAAGVQVQVISAVPQLPMVDDAEAARDAAQLVNDTYATILQRHPNRFVAYGAIALPHIDESLQQIAYGLDDLGFAGIGITSLVQQTISPADARFEPVFAELNRRGAIVYLHATGNGARCPMINAQGLEWAVGAPIEDGLALLHLLKADIPARYPGIRFHIAHLGGDLPFLAQRIEDNYEDWHAFPSSPLAALRRMWFDAANFHGPSLRMTLDTLDPTRIMCGSDYPYFQDAKYTRAIEYIREAGLDDDAVHAVLSGNAQRLYGDSLPAATY